MDAASQYAATNEASWQRRPNHFVGGLHTKAYLMQLDRPGQAWSIRFHPGAFRYFTRLPVHHLKNTLVAPEDIWGPAAQQWLDQLNEANSVQECWQLTESFLSCQLITQATNFPTDLILSHIERANGQCRVSALAQVACLSPAQFRARFNQYFGVSPKVYLRLFRLHYARQQFKTNQAFTELAYRSGYFDQAHFNRDVRLITALPPSQLFPLLQ